MTLLIQNGAMTITRSDGTTIFNSNDKLLHITDTVAGSEVIPVLNSGNNVYVNTTTYYDLGPVNAAATQIVGAVKFVLTTGTAGLAYNRWHMVMGGTVVWLMDGEPGFASRVGSNLGLAQYVGYHFDISASRARLVRRAVLKAVPVSYDVRAHTIEYKLRAGVWV